MDPELLRSSMHEFLALLDVGAESVTITGGTGRRTVVAISAPDAHVLIGPNGEHLRAMNILAHKIVEQRHGEEAANFLIDINNYHEAQMEKVRDNARMLPQRARLFKHDVEMSPMSPYERLVVHELFAEDPEIKTESAGEGKFRHIVLKYSSAARN
jgi:spoIIIJ-associated protein